MKKLILFTFILSTQVHAEPSRSPAVLDGSCNLNIPTSITKIINGKEVIIDRDIKEVLKEQCKEVRKCMNSAGEDEIDELKSLEAVACNNNLTAVTTKTPGKIIDKNYDGQRKPKTEDSSIAPSKNITPTAITK